MMYLLSYITILLSLANVLSFKTNNHVRYTNKNTMRRSTKYLAVRSSAEDDSKDKEISELLKTMKKTLADMNRYLDIMDANEDEFYSRMIARSERQCRQLDEIKKDYDKIGPIRRKTKRGERSR
jgi:hypothetical protein